MRSCCPHPPHWQGWWAIQRLSPVHDTGRVMLKTDLACDWASSVHSMLMSEGHHTNVGCFLCSLKR